MNAYFFIKEKSFACLSVNFKGWKFSQVLMFFFNRAHPSWTTSSRRPTKTTSSSTRPSRSGTAAPAAAASAAACASAAVKLTASTRGSQFEPEASPSASTVRKNGTMPRWRSWTESNLSVAAKMDLETRSGGKAPEISERSKWLDLWFAYHALVYTSAWYGKYCVHSQCSYDWLF